MWRVHPNTCLLTSRMLECMVKLKSKHTCKCIYVLCKTDSLTYCYVIAVLTSICLVINFPSHYTLSQIQTHPWVFKISWDQFTWTLQFFSNQFLDAAPGQTWAYHHQTCSSPALLPLSLSVCEHKVSSKFQLCWMLLGTPSLPRPEEKHAGKLPAK